MKLIKCNMLQLAVDLENALQAWTDKQPDRGSFLSTELVFNGDIDDSLLIFLIAAHDVSEEIQARYTTFAIKEAGTTPVSQNLEIQYQQMKDTELSDEVPVDQEYYHLPYAGNRVNSESWSKLLAQVLTHSVAVTYLFTGVKPDPKQLQQQLDTLAPVSDDPLAETIVVH